MKLSFLYEDEESLANKLLQAMSNQSGGSPHGSSWMKRKQDPMSPERQGFSKTDQQMTNTMGVPVQQYRSGNQKGTPTNPRHRKFFGAPDSGRSDALRPDDQAAIGAGETPVQLRSGDYGTSLRKR